MNELLNEKHLKHFGGHNEPLAIVKMQILAAQAMGEHDYAAILECELGMRLDGVRDDIRYGDSWEKVYEVMDSATDKVRLKRNKKIHQLMVGRIFKVNRKAESQMKEKLENYGMSIEDVNKGGF